MRSLLGTEVVKMLAVDALLDGVHVNVGNSIVAVEDARDFFKSGSLKYIVSNGFMWQKMHIHTLVSG